MTQKWTLRFVQVAWVTETIVCILFTMLLVSFGSTEQVSLWLQAIPTISLLIGAQGVAAGGGPLVSDAIKAKAGPV